MLYYDFPVEINAKNNSRSNRIDANKNNRSLQIDANNFKKKYRPNQRDAN